MVLGHARESQRRLRPGIGRDRPAAKGSALEVGIGQLALALVAGAAVGAFHFGGLWLTVRRVATSNRPVLLTFGSFVVRAVVAVAVMVWIARMHWQLLLTAMAGFVLVRVVMTRKLRPEDEAVAAKDGSST